MIYQAQLLGAGSVIQYAGSFMHWTIMFEADNDTAAIDQACRLSPAISVPHAIEVYRCRAFVPYRMIYRHEPGN